MVAFSRRLAVLVALVLMTGKVAAQLTQYSWTDYAGAQGPSGFVDGDPAMAGRFKLPLDVAVDAAGRQFIADTGNNAIRMINTAGTLSTLAGNGQAGAVDGILSGAILNAPSGIAVDANDNVYFAEGANGVIRKVSLTGVVTTFAGYLGLHDSVDGTGPLARFVNPVDVAVDASGNVYVADSDDDTIRKITPDGVVSTLAGTSGQAGSTNGNAADSLFSNPTSVTADASGNVYVADTGNGAIRMIAANGTVTTLASGLTGVRRIRATANGILYVAGGTTNLISRLASDGTLTSIAGSGLAGNGNGNGASAQFNNPSGLTIDSGGNLFIADTNNSSSRQISPNLDVTTPFGGGGKTGSADGNRVLARFSQPGGIGIDNIGNLFVADTLNKSVREILTNGTVSTYTTSFTAPHAVAVDSGTTIYVADAKQIIKVTSQEQVSVLYSSDSDLYGVAVDGSGNVFASDTAHNQIIEIKADGSETTLAGGTEGSMDGIGTNAQFNQPRGLAIDASGNLYVADYGNDTIRMITTDAMAGTVGTVTTVAGSPGATPAGDGFDNDGIDGNGSGARFNHPTAVAVDLNGNLYVADGYDTVRMITTDHQVTTIGGVAGVPGYSTGVYLAARFDGPAGIAVNNGGIVYVSDQNNNRISQGLPTTAAEVLTLEAPSISATGATVNGEANDNQNGGTTVSFEYGLTNVYGTTVAASPASVMAATPTPVSASLTGLTPGMTYHYRVDGQTSTFVTAGADRTFTTLSSDANLTALYLETGMLSPDFSPATTAYQVSLSNTTTSITLTPQAESSLATVSVTATAGMTTTFTITEITSQNQSVTIPLQIGVNNVQIAVVANDNNTTQTYTVAVTRKDIPPSNLSYAMTPVTYTKGLPITTNTPSHDGGMVTSYTVTPDLPAGLTLNPTTGEISGTPTALASMANYTVTATNSGGFTSVVVTITVIDMPPSNLSYTTPVSYTRFVPITPDVPTSSGGAVETYAISPDLPAGLMLDPTTGMISGTPQVAAGAMDYTVTATNTGGSTMATVNIEVIARPSIVMFPQTTFPERPVDSTGTSNYTVLIPIVRTEAENDAVTLDVTASSTGYTYGTQYTFVNQTDMGKTSVTFAAGQTMVLVPIRILQPATLAPGSFTLSLTLTGGFASLGATTTATVTVSTLDTTKPVLVLTSPSKSTSGATFDIIGTVEDNDALGVFSVTLNGHAVPLTTDPTVNFVAGQPNAFSALGVAAENGSNTLIVRAVDPSGNASSITKTFTYTNNRPELAGTYVALISPSGTATIANTGMATVTVTATGTFTGKAAFANGSVAFSGILKDDGGARFKPSLNETQPLVLAKQGLGTLAFNIGTANGLVGTLVDPNNSATTLATLSGMRNAATATAGTYTVAFPSAEQTPEVERSLYPQGACYASLVVAKTGGITLTGALADGTAYTAAGHLRSDQSLPLFTSLYTKQGFFQGALNFATLADSDVAGSVFQWLRPPNTKAGYYREGWPVALKLEAFGALYYPKAKAATESTPAIASSLDFGQGLPDTVNGNARLIFTDGALNGTVSEEMSIDPAKGTIRLVPAGTKEFKFALSPKGVFSGTFQDTDLNMDAYHGVVITKGVHQGGYGYFLNPAAAAAPGLGLSGGVLLLPGM